MLTPLAFECFPYMNYLTTLTYLETDENSKYNNDEMPIRPE